MTAQQNGTKCFFNLLQSKAPSAPATMSKQRSTLSKQHSILSKESFDL